jgi:hypothetical protein
LRLREALEVEAAEGGEEFVDAVGLAEAMGEEAVEGLGGGMGEEVVADVKEVEEVGELGEDNCKLLRAAEGVGK